MGQLQKIESELKQLGFQIIAASPDPIEKLKATLDKNQLTFTLVSDDRVQAAEAFGLAFKVEDAVVERYSKSGITIQDGKLPVPAVFLIERGGKISYGFAHPDHRIRLDAEVLLAAARAAVANK